MLFNKVKDIDIFSTSYLDDVSECVRDGVTGMTTLEMRVLSLFDIRDNLTVNEVYVGFDRKYAKYYRYALLKEDLIVMLDKLCDRDFLKFVEKSNKYNLIDIKSDGNLMNITRIYASII